MTALRRFATHWSRACQEAVCAAQGNRSLTVAALSGALSVLLAATAAAADQPAVSFNRDIRPILSNKCFQCHGPDEAERQAELRLDTQEGSRRDLGGYAAVKPGDPQHSELIARVTNEDEYLVMPPQEAGKPLSASEIDLLRRWIAQGAEYDTHWSYTKPVRPELPPVKDTAWPRNEIDHFILARLEREGLRPSAEADRYTLIRRLALDLTGLPPTPQEVDVFLADEQPDAYERLVDRLLAKDAYGEHQARLWLDLARYADSAGYADDPPRTIWAYRDYVIRSFNENKPFDRFTVEQIAGDLLPDPAPEQLVATAFHRNTQTNNEGGTNDEEFRNVAVVDRVNTTMAVWMGTTMACAQCHTHKFDPITQEEYFRFYAIFNNTADADRRDESPVLEVWTDEQKSRKAEIAAQLAAVEEKLSRSTPELAAARAKWEAEIAADAAGAARGRFVRVELVDRTEFLSLAEVQVFAGEKNIAPEGTATQSSTDYEGPAKLAIDGNTNGDYFAAKSTTHTKNEKNPWWQVDLGRPVDVRRIVVWNRTDGGTGSRLAGFRVSVLDENRQPVWQQVVEQPPSPQKELATSAVPADVLAVIRIPPDQRTKEQEETVARYYASIAPELAGARAEKARLEKQLAAIEPTTVPIFRELPEDQRRTTKIQFRGNFLDTGPVVEPGVPAVFHDLPPGSKPDRLALARWLVDEDNPLTGRVIANRLWERTFGKGLVPTSEEFGSQGEPPTHPELLDWLAVEFVEGGWDVKKFLKLLVTSATYRQESGVRSQGSGATTHHSPLTTHSDPDNRLYSRGPRFRLSAEAIRDQALFVSGLLSDKMYGPPVRPPQPEMGLNAAFGGNIDWKASEGADRYRRGIYTTWRRSNPYPSMAAFDAPSREVCTVRRDRTNTPLQALVTLNDPVYVEAAQALARRMAAHGGTQKTPEEIAAHGFRLCLVRPPKPEETERLVALYCAAKERYAAEPDQARQMATDPLGPLPEGADAAELAAWTVVGNVLLNLDEMFMKR